MGLANRLSRRGSKVLTTFDIGVGEVVGSPIRQSIYQGNASRIGDGERKLLVIGGSQGAARINDAVRAADLRGWTVKHIAGKGKAQGSELEFVDNIGDYLAWADVVVSRAGSNSVCELLALRKPTLLIPMSTGRGDQVQNARYVSGKGAMAVLYEETLTPEVLVKGVNQVWEARGELVANIDKHFSGIDGTEAIARIITHTPRHASRATPLG